MMELKNSLTGQTHLDGENNGEEIETPKNHYLDLKNY